jgi:predicted O-methyltransferase YrrM
MSPRTLPLTDDLYAWLRQHGLREPEVLRRLREETERLPEARMLTAPEQAQLLALLVQLIGARRTLEVGVFTGYSALWIALALPRDGRIVACDLSPEWSDVARRHFEQAGVTDKLDLRLGPALDSLDSLLAAGEAGRFDFAYIDADKESEEAYFERCLQLVRPGGLIAIDNLFWGGRVVDRDQDDPATQAVRALARQLRHDPRVDIALIPIGDGLALARKVEGE